MMLHERFLVFIFNVFSDVSLSKVHSDSRNEKDIRLGHQCSEIVASIKRKKEPRENTLPLWAFY